MGVGDFFLCIMLSRMDSESEVFSEPVTMPSSGLLPPCADFEFVLETLAARPPHTGWWLSAQCGFLTPGELTSVLRVVEARPGPFGKHKKV